MKRLLCLIVTIGCLAGLLAGCGDVPAAQNSILSSSRTASSAWASGEAEESDLSDPEQPIQEDSSRAEEGDSSASSQKEEGTGSASSAAGTSSKSPPAVSKSAGQGGGGKTAASDPPASNYQTPDAASSPEQTPAPEQTPPASSQGGNSGGQEEPKDPNVVTIRFAVECQAAVDKGNQIAKKISKNGYVLAPVTMELEKGATVYDALKKSGLVFTSEGGMFGQYVSSIQSLAEKACGDQSGWKYEVNGVFPGVSCSVQKLQDGDTVIWHYSLTV